MRKMFPDLPLLIKAKNIQHKDRLNTMFGECVLLSIFLSVFLYISDILSVGYSVRQPDHKEKERIGEECRWRRGKERKEEDKREAEWRGKERKEEDKREAERRGMERRRQERSGEERKGKKLGRSS